ncbi:MAG: S-methyl-5'-thioadenosine phosphorylase [Nitrospirae bacterium]|nr:S-methyl-5'-thioadenosine phosphorylase [Nitrospirota bacterium]
MKKIGIISGSGLYEIKGLTIKKRKKLSTPFGSPSDHYTIGYIEDAEVIFLPRHGSHHSIPPHMINYRANIWGFKKLGVERIVSISAVGGINKSCKPGNIVLLDQIIDMTRNRKSTFYDGKSISPQSPGSVVHIDFTEPYCPALRRTILKAGTKAGITLNKTGTYMAVEGPRLETAAEIRAFGKLGSDVVGMTGMPEASLAREAEICFSGISVVANYAAGINRHRLTTTEVIKEMRAASEKIKKLLRQTIIILPDRTGCSCADALKEAKI